MEKYIVTKPCRTDEFYLLINGDIIYLEEDRLSGFPKYYIYLESTRQRVGYTLTLENFKDA